MQILGLGATVPNWEMCHFTQADQNCNEKLKMLYFEKTVTWKKDEKRGFSL